MKKILVLLMVLCSVGFGANFYVDPTNGVDATGDGTVSSPEKTIAAAIADAASGDNIYLLAGTYDDTTQGAGWFITAPATKSLTFMPDPATNPTITLTPTTATGLVKHLADRTGYTLTFSNLTLTAGSAYVHTFGGAGIGGNVVFNTCSFPSEKSIENTSTTPTNATYIRKARYYNCTSSWTTGADSYGIQLTGADSLVVKDCTFQNASTSTTKPFIYAPLLRGGCVIDGCAITSVKCFYCESFQDNRGSIKIINCDFVEIDSTVSTAITLGSSTNNSADTVAGVAVQDCNITGFNYGIYHFAAKSNISGNTIYCASPLVFWGGGENVIINNTLKAYDTASQGRCLVVGRKLYGKLGSSDSAGTANTDFEATTIAEGSETDWDLSLVSSDCSMVALVTSTNTGSPVPVYYGVISGVSDETDTITVHKWIKCSDQTTETPADDTYYISCAKFSERNYVCYNIMDGGDATNTFTFDFNPKAGDNYVNYNCYVAGTGGLANLGVADIDTLAEFVTKWQTWPNAWTSSYYNDEDSIEADPQFVNTTDPTKANYFMPTNANVKFSDGSFAGAVPLAETVGRLKR
jgi:hypothetical protein